MKKSCRCRRGLWKWVLLGLLGLMCLILAVSALRGRMAITVSRYEVPLEKLTGSFRVVQLSDVHNREFGKDNARLLEKVRREQPDLILVTGDMVTETLPGHGPALVLLEKLPAIAPTYVALGNHELEYGARFAPDFVEKIPATGAVLLEKEYVDLEVKGQAVRIGGLFGYCLPAIHLESGEAKLEECEFLWEFQDTERCTLLMNHMPVCWLLNGSLDYWDVDCVFSGHAHGGQVRLPFLGGIYAPDQGFFPGWVQGHQTSAEGSRHLIISRGLGSSVPIPRVFNDPELVVVDFMPAP